MSLTRPQYPDTPGTRRCVWFSTSCCAAQPHGSAQRPLATPLSLGAERMSEKRFALKKTNAMHVRAGHDTMSSLRMPAPPSLSSIWDPHLVSLTPALPTFSLRNHSSKVKIQVLCSQHFEGLLAISCLPRSPGALYPPPRAVIPRSSHAPILPTVCRSPASASMGRAHLGPHTGERAAQLPDGRRSHHSVPAEESQSASHNPADYACVYAPPYPTPSLSF